MPTYSITAPNGKNYTIEGPEGATQEQVIQQILSRDPKAGDAAPETTVAGNVKEFFKGVVPGAVGLVEGAVTGASSMLPEEYEKATRAKTKEIAGAIKAPFAAAPGYEETVTRKLGEGVGSVLPFLAMAPLGIPGAIAAVGTGVAAGAGEARGRAEESGATAEQRKLSTLSGAVVGSTEAMPIFRLLGRLGKTATDTILDRVRRAAITGGEEGAQEAAAQALQNLIAKGIYKPEQAIIEGTGEAGAYGAGVGVIIDMALGRRAKGARPGAPGAPAEESPINQAIAAQTAAMEAAEKEAAAKTAAEAVAGAPTEAVAGTPTVTKKGRKGKAAAVVPEATVEEEPGVAPTILDEQKLVDIGVKKNKTKKTAFSDLSGADVSDPAQLPKILAILKAQVGFYTKNGDTERAAKIQSFIDDITPTAEAPVVEVPTAPETPVAEAPVAEVPVETPVAPTIAEDQNVAAPIGEPVGASASVVSEPIVPAAPEGVAEAQPVGVVPTEQDADAIAGREGQQPAALTGVTVTGTTLVKEPGVPTATKVTLSDGSTHELVRLDSSQSMGLPGWHGPTGYLADTKAEAIAELVRKANKETPLGQQPAALTEAPALEELTAARDKLLTPSGKVPSPKSNARKQYDALQSQIDDLTPTPARNEYEPPLVEGLTPQKEKALRIKYAAEQKEAEKLEKELGELRDRLFQGQDFYNDGQKQAIQSQINALSKPYAKATQNAEKTYYELYDKDKAEAQEEVGETYVSAENARRKEAKRTAKLSNEERKSYPYNLTSLEAVHDELRDQMSHMPEYKAYIEKYFTLDRSRLKNKASEKEAIAEGQRLIDKSTIFNEQALDSVVPTTAEFTDAVNKGSTRKALQALLRDDKTHPLVKLVIQRILKAGTLPKLSVVPAGTLGVHPTDPSKIRIGEYDAVSDSIRIDERGINGANLVHEVMHGFLHRKIIDYTVGEYGDAQIKRIDDLYQFLKTNHPDLAESYGMTDLSEFVSEAMSNIEFQRAINNIPYKTGSFYGQFARAVLKFFGITDTNDKWNALSEALISTETAMQSGRLFQEARTGTEMKGPSTAYAISTPGATAAAAQADIIGVASDPTLSENAKQVLGAKLNRSYLTDKLNSIDRKLFAGYGGRLFDALGNINPSELLAQALDASRVVERAFFEGFLDITPDGMFTATEGKLANGEEASLKSIFAIVNKSAKQTGKSIGEERKTLSAMLVGHREFELDKYNNLPTTVVGIELRISDPVDRNNLERQFQANPDAQKILEIMDAMRFNRIDMMVAAGRISQTKAAFWKSTSGYVPFQDINALESMIATQKTGPTKGLARVAKYKPIKGAVDVQVGDSIDAFIGLISNMGMDAIKNNAVSKASQTLTLLGHAKRISPIPPLSQQEKQHIVDTYVNGVPARYYFDDPLDAAAFAGMPSEISTVTSIMQSFSRGLRASVTLIPGFGVSQVLQDITRAYSLSDVANPAALIPRILLNFPRAAFGELTGRKSKDVIRMENMGVMATFDISTRGTVKSIMQQVGAQNRSLGDYILLAAESISKGSDIAVRKAIYEQSMKETRGNEALSISRAREIINFSRRGNAKFVDFMVRTVPFTNAYIRGMDKLYTAATGKGNMYGMTQAEARGMFRNRMLTLSAIGLTYALMMAGDDEYESLDESIRDSHFIIPGIKFGETPLAIPLPRDLAFIFKAIPERVVNYFRKHGTDEEKSGLRVLGELTKQGISVIAAPNATPTALLPIIETVTNHSFFLDRALESQAQRAMDPSMRYGRGTSELTKAVSKGLTSAADELSNVGLDTVGEAIKLSPIKLENLFRGIMGTSATLVLAMGDELLAPDRTEKQMKRGVLAQITGASALMIDPVGKRQSNALYDLYEKLDMVKKTLDAKEKINPMEADEYGSKHLPELDAYPYVNILYKRIQELNTRIKLIDAEKSLTPKERMEAIADVTREQNEASKDVDRINSFLSKARAAQ